MPDKSVEDWRRKIDEIDRRLVELLNERSRWRRREIGRIKQASGEALYQPDREKQVLVDGVVRANPGPLPDAAIRRLFERILDEARSVERRGDARRRDGKKAKAAQTAKGGVCGFAVRLTRGKFLDRASSRKTAGVEIYRRHLTGHKSCCEFCEWNRS